MKLRVRLRLLGGLALKTAPPPVPVPAPVFSPASVGMASDEALQQISVGEGLGMGVGVGVGVAAGEMADPRGGWRRRASVRPPRVLIVAPLAGSATGLHKS
jgi:hypothetical protein